MKSQTLALLRDYVAGMNLDNFVVRPHRRAVERFQGEGVWAEIGEDARSELLDEVAPLPSAESWLAPARRKVRFVPKADVRALPLKQPNSEITVG